MKVIKISFAWRPGVIVHSKNDLSCSNLTRTWKSLGSMNELCVCDLYCHCHVKKGCFGMWIFLLNAYLLLIHCNYWCTWLWSMALLQFYTKYLLLAIYNMHSSVKSVPVYNCGLCMFICLEKNNFVVFIDSCYFF